MSVMLAAMRWLLVLVAACSSGAPDTQPLREGPPATVVRPATAPPVDAQAAPAAPAAPTPAAPPTFSAHTISVNDGFACARTRDAKVTCWSGGHEPRATPFPIAGLENIAGVAATRNEVYAWSSDGVAWRSMGGAKPKRLAVQGVVEVAADAEVGADAYTCARRRADTIACWLDGKPATEIPIGGAAREVVVAGHHACARRAGGDVLCWSAEKPRGPTAFAPARGALAIAGRNRGTRGDLFAAVLPGGRVVEWLGATRASVKAPATPSDVARIAVGDHAACALGAKVTCWLIDVPGEVYDVPGVAGALELGVGTWVSCAHAPDGQARCWGMDANVGDGAQHTDDVPVDVPGLEHVVQLGASSDTTCARTSDGRVACWGRRRTVEDDRYLYDLVPVFVDGISDAAELAVALRDTCVRRVNGKVMCWGLVNDKRTPPIEVPAFEGASWLGAISADVCANKRGKIVCSLEDPYGPFPRDSTRIWDGGHFRQAWRCARLTTGVSCQGAYYGRGEQSAGSSDLGTDLHDIVDMRLPINQGSEDLCVLRASGKVECRTTDSDHLEPVTSLDHVIALATAREDVCGLRAKGTVECWHLSTRDGGTGAPVPRRMPRIDDAVELVGDESHACVRRKRGTVACWGRSEQVGAGTRATTETPVAARGVLL